MRVGLLLLYYFWWHYTSAVADLVRNYGYLSAFVKNYFSVGPLLRHLASPWRRLGEPYPEHFDPAAFFSALFVNTLMRLVGILCRLALLAVGVTVFVLLGILFLAALLIWLLLPFILVFLIVLAVRLLTA